MTGQPTTIQLDMKHYAIRDGNTWTVMQMRPTGGHTTRATWTGNRKSIYTYCETHDITPSRAAGELIDTLPEQPGFRPDPPRLKQQGGRPEVLRPGDVAKPHIVHPGYAQD